MARLELKIIVGLGPDQCDQIRRFLNVLGTRFL